MTGRPPSFTLFPTTPLFRSPVLVDESADHHHRCHPYRNRRQLDLLPWPRRQCVGSCFLCQAQLVRKVRVPRRVCAQVEEEEDRSEEHTSELQSLAYLVCRLL